MLNSICWENRLNWSLNVTLAAWQTLVAKVPAGRQTISGGDWRKSRKC